jgi:hypothetical protein
MSLQSDSPKARRNYYRGSQEAPKFNEWRPLNATAAVYEDVEAVELSPAVVSPLLWTWRHASSISPKMLRPWLKAIPGIVDDQSQASDFEAGD